MKFFYYVGVYAFCVSVHRILSEPKRIMNNAKEIARDCREIIDISNGKEPEEEEIGFRPKKVVNKIGF